MSRKRGYDSASPPGGEAGSGDDRKRRWSDAWGNTSPFAQAFHYERPAGSGHCLEAVSSGRCNVRKECARNVVLSSLAPPCRRILSCIASLRQPSSAPFFDSSPGASTLRWAMLKAAPLTWACRRRLGKMRAARTMGQSGPPYAFVRSDCLMRWWGWLRAYSSRSVGCN